MDTLSFRVYGKVQNGYDGKGVKIVKTFEDIKNLRFGMLNRKKVKIKRSFIIVARNTNKDETCFPIVEMEFNDDSNLVEYVICPAKISRIGGKSL